MTTNAATPLEHAAAVTAAYRDGVTRPLDWRRGQLTALRDLLHDNGREIEDAVRADLGKPGAEALVTEISAVLTEIRDALKHLDRWAAPRTVPVLVRPGTARTVPEPLGTVLVVAPWNYPVNLLLAPLVGALAAGNAVVLKPSELAPRTSAVMARLVPRYLDTRAVRVVEGAVAETTELLTYPWDHIFYTGNGTVGRIVLEAAAKHLTPVTLELGGKSPVYVDGTADVTAVAAWLAWGKFLNAGQTCVAPDYVLAPASVVEALVPALEKAVASLYGTDPRTSPDYGRIVNDRHLRRVAGLIDPAKVAFGGDTDPDDRYIAPTVLTGVTAQDAVMGEEIFGPVLPVLTVSGREEAVRFVTDRDKPLALYLFSTDRATHEVFTEQTSSGGLVVNAVVTHLAVGSLPFGGVGPSGMGAYHGERGFRTFSHDKAVLTKPARRPGLPFSLALPPFTRTKSRALRTLLR